MNCFELIWRTDGQRNLSYTPNNDLDIEAGEKQWSVPADCGGAGPQPHEGQEEADGLLPLHRQQQRPPGRQQEDHTQVFLEVISKMYINVAYVNRTDGQTY